MRLSGILCLRGKQGRWRTAWFGIRRWCQGAYTTSTSERETRRLEKQTRCAGKREKERREREVEWDKYKQWRDGREVDGGEEIADAGGELQSVPDGFRSRALRLPLYSPLACKPTLSSVGPHPRGISRSPILSPISARSGHRYLSPSNLSTSGQPHLLACPQDINRIQRLVSVYTRICTLTRGIYAYAHNDAD